MMVTIDIEGDKDTLPHMLEMLETVATLIQAPEEHDFSVCVRPIETQDWTIFFPRSNDY